jgi:alkylhydroperoxidase family enzyme
MTPPSEANGKLKEVYDTIAKEVGEVPFGLQFLSARPGLLEIYYRMYRDSTAQSLLTKNQISLLAYEAAKADGCKICKNLSESNLKNLGMNEEEIKVLDKDIKKSTLDQKTKNLLIYGYSVAEDPHNKDGVVNAFKSLGLTDEELLDTAAITLANKNILDLIHGLGYHSK